MSEHRDRLIARVVEYVREHPGCSGLDIQRSCGVFAWRAFHRDSFTYEHASLGEPCHGIVYKRRGPGGFGHYMAEVRPS